MERHHRQIEELLLELHMGSISDDDRLWLESQLQQHPSLSEQCDRIGDVLRPLDHWTIGAMPESVISKTLDRVARARESEQSDDDVRPEASGHRFPVARWRELLAVAACLGLLVGAALPSLFEMRDRSRRTICAANLGTISQGTKLYQAAFGGSLPYAGVVRNASWLPTSLSSGPLASNSRHMYLLAKHNYGPTPKNFVCPSSASGKPMSVEAMASYDDFAQLDNISYASQNLSGRSPNLRPTRSIAYAGDPNPLFAGGRFDDSVDPNSANSPAHGGRGQMVMTLDGSTRWMTTPVYGSSHDNVWLIGDLRAYNGTESPAEHNDSQLVPGFPTTDPKVRAMLAR